MTGDPAARAMHVLGLSAAGVRMLELRAQERVIQQQVAHADAAAADGDATPQKAKRALVELSGRRPRANAGATAAEAAAGVGGEGEGAGRAYLEQPGFVTFVARRRCNCTEDCLADSLAQMVSPSVSSSAA